MTPEQERLAEAASRAPRTGAGLGASHQTCWTALVAKLLQQCVERCGGHRRL